MNVRDSEVICGILTRDGYEIVSEPDNAEIILFNTCSVRQHAEEKVWSQVGKFAKVRLKGQSPSGTVPIIGIVGCMAQNYQEDIFRRAPNVDFVVGPSDIHKIPEIIKLLSANHLFENKIWETESSVRPQEIYHTGYYNDKTHAYVVISEGCSNFCSYCVVPYVRGELHNRPHQDILQEIKEAIDKGITNITLLGQNVNAYQDDGINFLKLVNLVNLVKGLKDFSFITSHPKDTAVELFKAMADCEKLKKCLHLPVQSGSDRVLQLMNRGYTKKLYLDLAANYRKIVKAGVLTTDIIVGFPGETEDDFQDTYNLIKGVEFDAAYIFKYSPRPHTTAEKLIDDVPKDEKERRHALVLGLQKKISERKSNIKNQTSKILK